jgi:hypothetical protein
MAELLETGQMLANLYEPKRKFRWILQIDGIDAFVCKTAARPQMTFEETAIDYVNQKRYIAGKMAPNTMAISMHDPIAPSAAQKVMTWVRLCYEVLTGRMGYADQYQKDFALKLLDPQGAVVEHWDIRRAWIQDTNFGDLDYSTSDNAEIQLVIRYDLAVQQY